MFAFGGRDDDFKLLGSIECLKVNQDSKWCVVVIYNELVMKLSPALAVLSPSKIVVYGGNSGKQVGSDGYIFDVDQGQVRPIIGNKSKLDFVCQSQVQWAGKGRFMTLGHTKKDEHLHLV